MKILKKLNLFIIIVIIMFSTNSFSYDTHKFNLGAGVVWQPGIVFTYSINAIDESLTLYTAFDSKIPFIFSFGWISSNFLELSCDLSITPSTNVIVGFEPNIKIFFVKYNYNKFLMYLRWQLISINTKEFTSISSLGTGTGIGARFLIYKDLQLEVYSNLNILINLSKTGLDIDLPDAAGKFPVFFIVPTVGIKLLYLF